MQDDKQQEHTYSKKHKHRFYVQKNRKLGCSATIIVKELLKLVLLI